MMTTLILPVYNEYDNLKRNFPIIYQKMQELGEFEIIIAENGPSKDGTVELAQSLAKLPNVKCININSPGKGFALKKGIAIAKGDVIGYLDIDLSVPVKHIGQAIAEIRNGSTVVYGSRYMKGSKSKRTAYRFVASKVFNFLIQVIDGSKITDHQCGFKFYERNYIMKGIHEINDNRFFFDVETLLWAGRLGATTYALPVEFIEMKGSKIKPKDIFYYIGCMIRFRVELNARL